MIILLLICLAFVERMCLLIEVDIITQTIPHSKLVKELQSACKHILNESREVVCYLQ